MDHGAAHSFVADSAPLLGFALLFVLIFRRMGHGVRLAGHLEPPRR